MVPFGYASWSVPSLERWPVLKGVYMKKVFFCLALFAGVLVAMQSPVLAEGISIQVAPSVLNLDSNGTWVEPLLKGVGSRMALAHP